MNLKKQLFTILSVFLLSGASALAQTNVGITLSGVSWDASGKETVKSSGTENTKSDSGVAPLASIFIEREADNGAVIGLDIVPHGQKIGDGSNARTDTDTDDASDTAGTNKVDVKFDKMFTIYAELPVALGYIKVGASQLTIVTDESSATGSTYGDEDTNAFLIGFGKKGEMANGMVWKSELLFQQVQGVTFDGSTDSDSVKNVITLDDVDTVQLRLSVAKSF